MRVIVFLFVSCLAGGFLQAQAKKEFVGKEQAGAQIERFTLKTGRSYEGIWDAAKSQIHVVSKTNHVGNLAVKPADIASRKVIGDGSKVKIYSDVDIAEQVLIRTRQNLVSTQTRVATANRNRDTLHATYKGKSLPDSTYKAVMAQYQAADAEVANAEKAVMDGRTAFDASLQAYQQAGGKNQYAMP